MAYCSSCTAPVVWVHIGTGAAGRPMPVDGQEIGRSGHVAPLEVPGGGIEPTGALSGGRNGVAAPVVEVVGPRRGRWRSHFATCPNAGRHRRPAAPGPEQGALPL